MTTSAAQAEVFYTEVLDSGEVWTIQDAAGYPAPENSDGRRAMPFWSKRSRAERIVGRVAAYAAFDVTRIPMDEWRARWLPGLQRDGMLLGLNWSGGAATG